MPPVLCMCVFLCGQWSKGDAIKSLGQWPGPSNSVLEEEAGAENQCIDWQTESAADVDNVGVSAGKINGLLVSSGCTEDGQTFSRAIIGFKI